ncbi:MAG: hypothetical protein K2W94_02595 [Alphaproteobacteria bacterium]|nr:hypothetical protein [Alphaproteobacteria bacterium]
MNINIAIFALGFLFFFQTFLVAMEEERMERQGTSLIAKTTDPLGRPANAFISEEMFNQLNRPFAEIDLLQPPPLTSNESDFTNFLRAVEAEENGGLKKIFSIREKEAVIMEGQLEDDFLFSYFVTGGIHNCVAIALYGCNPETGTFFTGLAHVRRKNKPSVIKPLLDKLSAYPNQRITLHSGYKSETLLNIFQYIFSRGGLAVTSVYVNSAYHAVQNDQVSITYHPQYFGKTSTSEIPDNTSYFSLFPPVHGQNQRASNVIIEVKTGRLVEIPAAYHHNLLLNQGKNFVSLTNQLRIPGLQTEKDFEIYKPLRNLDNFNLAESSSAATSKKPSKGNKKK